jgi:hypothetical protein
MAMQKFRLSTGSKGPTFNDDFRELAGKSLVWMDELMKNPPLCILDPFFDPCPEGTPVGLRTTIMCTIMPNFTNGVCNWMAQHPSLVNTDWQAQEIVTAMFCVVASTNPINLPSYAQPQFDIGAVCKNCMTSMDCKWEHVKAAYAKLSIAVITPTFMSVGLFHNRCYSDENMYKFYDLDLSSLDLYLQSPHQVFRTVYRGDQPVANLLSAVIKSFDFDADLGSFQDMVRSVNNQLKDTSFVLDIHPPIHEFFMRIVNCMDDTDQTAACIADMDLLLSPGLTPDEFEFIFKLPNGYGLAVFFNPSLTKGTYPMHQWEAKNFTNHEVEVYNKIYEVHVAYI